MLLRQVGPELTVLASYSGPRRVSCNPNWRCYQNCYRLAVPSSGAGWTVAGGRPSRAATTAAASPTASPSVESERLAQLTGYLGDRGVELGIGWSCKVTPKCVWRVHL